MTEKHNWISDDICLIEETTDVKLFGTVGSDVNFIARLLNDANECLVRLEKENKELKEENKDLVSQNKSSQYIIEKLKKCYNNVLDEMDDLAEIHNRENDLLFQTIDGLLNMLYDADIGVLIEESVSERLEKWKRSCRND